MLPTSLRSVGSSCSRPFAEQGRAPCGLTPRSGTRLAFTYPASEANYLLTMGRGDACPVVPGTTREDRPPGDPKGQDMETVRQLRDGILARVEQLVQREGLA